MKSNDKLALHLAGALLIASSVFSQILDKSIGQVLILGLSGLIFSILAFPKKTKQKVVCDTNPVKRKPLKILGVMLGVIVVFGGIGFLFGQLLYHVLN